MQRKEIVLIRIRIGLTREAVMHNIFSRLGSVRVFRHNQVSYPDSSEQVDPRITQ